jgi:vanillate O-demethylase monooxygenase subunit
MRPAMLPIDKGAVRARRIMEAKLAREAAGEPAAAGHSPSSAQAGHAVAAQGQSAATDCADPAAAFWKMLNLA